jgi:alkanesulfonate monooxygenase SsuD/methylene tetrahydromethanopterin reductase-like flavin-dependent oxidoreductase (luciferase family)
VAKQLGTLAALAGDRVTLGVGAGWLHEEFETLGIDPADRFSRLDEHVALMRNAWRNGVTEFSGQWYSHIPAGFHPIPKREIPVLVGGSGPVTLRRVARWGDGWAMPGVPGADDLRTAIAEQLDRLRRVCDAEGRDFDELLLVAGGSVTSDPALFEALAEAGVHEVDVALADQSDFDLERADAVRRRIAG